MPPAKATHRVVSLFSGIGGLDLGLAANGHEIVEMCESWEPARRVLEARFPGVPIARDVRTFAPETSFSVLSAGFPCADLSHAGAQRGIFGPQSGLVDEVFRIAEARRPAWLVLENVVNLLRLHGGAGIRHVLAELERLGYAWAYRVVDSRAFGVAQRRNRVLILASRTSDPARALLAEDDDADDATGTGEPGAWGFYWTEGRRGVGLIADSIPTLKGGSTVGLPSSPAIWRPSADAGYRIVTPSIETAEELQGFPRGWTGPADKPGETSARWKLVGNAVTVGVSQWLGERISAPDASRLSAPGAPFDPASTRKWPDAAYGAKGSAWSVDASRLPREPSHEPLDVVVGKGDVVPLSFRATKGFLARIEESGIALPEAFMADLESHLASMRGRTTARNEPRQSFTQSPRRSSARSNGTTAAVTTEASLRRALTLLGVRYRLHARPEPTLRWRADLVVAPARLAVDVRACFWHGCPDHNDWPAEATRRWHAKLAKNRARDAAMADELERAGWRVVAVWEHEDPDEAAERVRAIAARRRSSELIGVGSESGGHSVG